MGSRRGSGKPRANTENDGVRILRALCLIAGSLALFALVIGMFISGLPFDSNRPGMDALVLFVMAWQILLILFGTGRLKLFRRSRR
jgi:hypothetical protein